MLKNIRTWSHPMWSFIHSLPNLCGPNSEERIACIFGLLISVIPCDTCREHATMWVQNHPLHSVVASEFALYFYSLHNSVNLRTHTRPASRSVLSRYRMDPRYSLSSLISSVLKFRSDELTKAVLADVAALTNNTL